MSHGLSQSLNQCVNRCVNRCVCQKLNPCAIDLYEAENIDQLLFPDTEEGQFAKKMLVPLIKNGVSSFFDNVKTEMKILKIDEFVLPITINDKEKDNSYVCSFYSYYIGYGLSQAESIKNKILKQAAKAILRGLGSLLKMGKIDKIVSINNWLFSTNIYPDLTAAQILAIRKFIEKKYKDFAIVFRSIDSFDQKKLKENLEENKFDLIASRQIFITDPKKKEIFDARLFKSDLKFFKETPYSWAECKGESDANKQEELFKILSLYDSLYLEKYSHLNPKFKLGFIELAVRENFFNFKVLKKIDEIEGIVGYYSLYGVMTSPFFGYDLMQPKEAGLYRLLSTSLILEAQKTGLLFHQSSGASFYKSIRKATASLEYNAIYFNHLPFHRHLCWKILKAIINSFGISWMKRY